MSECPCGSNASYEVCCGRFHSGEAEAPTAEALMRARYTAYVKCDIDFLSRTIPILDRKTFDRNSAKVWAQAAEWCGLEIVSCKNGGPEDSKGVVEFRAHFKIQGEPQVHHEIGQFKKHGSRWMFVDGKIVVPEEETAPAGQVSRNASCPCGSGKKFKRCCGA